MIAAILRYPLGRGGRAEYWTGVLVGVALITVAGWFEDFTPKLLTWLAAAILWFILTPRRLRDIGWWTGLVLLPLVPAVAAIILLIVSNQATMYLSFMAGLLLMSAWPILIVLLLLVGAWKPKPPPPPGAEDQADVFS